MDVIAYIARNNSPYLYYYTICFMTATQYLASLKPGDKATRILGGRVILPVIVHSIEKDKIVVIADDPQWKERIIEMAKTMEIPLSEVTLPTWDFHPTTGAEIDEDLGWDGVTKTGSYLKIPTDEKETG